jgi:hypothetical protein
VKLRRLRQPPWFFFLNFANYRKNSGNIEVSKAKVRAVHVVDSYPFIHTFPYF